MASLLKIKRKKGFAYRIQYRQNGKNHYEYLRVGTTPEQARLRTKEIELQLIQNNHSPQTNLTLSSFERWFFQNKQNAAKRTIETYYRAFRFLSVIGDESLKNLPRRLPDIERALIKYSPTTRSIIIRSLRAAWQFGIDRGIVQNNPFKKIAIITKRKFI